MRYTPLLFSALFSAPLSYAGDLELNGFLSAIGGVATKQHDAALSADETSKESILGYGEDVTFNSDSVFGLQVSASLSDKTSIVGQLISRGSDDYQTELSWAYVSYAASKNLTLSLGRFRTPFYTYSAFIEVGYAYPWIAPSSDVYSIQLDNIDGVDAVYSSSLTENVSLDLQLYAGSVNSDFNIESADFSLDAETRNHIGFAATLNYSNLSLRGSIHQADITVANLDSVELGAGQSIGTLRAALDSFGLDSELLNINDVGAVFAQAGLKYDGERIFFIAELIDVDFDGDTPLADQSRYHSTLGLNFGNAMVYVGYAESDDEPVALDSDLGGNAQLEAVLGAPLRAIASAFAVVNETKTVGIRYNFDTGAAVKLQYESFSSPATDRVSLILNPDADLSGDISEGIVRFGVDLVF